MKGMVVDYRQETEEMMQEDEYVEAWGKESRAELEKWKKSDVSRMGNDERALHESTLPYREGVFYTSCGQEEAMEELKAWTGHG